MKWIRLVCVLLLMTVAAGASAQEPYDAPTEGFDLSFPQDIRAGEPFTLKCTPMEGATAYLFQVSTAANEDMRTDGAYAEVPEAELVEKQIAGAYYARACAYREKGTAYTAWVPFEIGEPKPENRFLFGEYSANGVSVLRYMGSVCPEVLEIPETHNGKYVRRIDADFVTAGQQPKKILLPKTADDTDGIENIPGATFVVHTGSGGEEYCIRHRLPYELADDGTPDFEVELGEEPEVNKAARFFLKIDADEVYIYVNGEHGWTRTEKAGKRGVLVEKKLFEKPGVYTVRFATVQDENGQQKYSGTLVLNVNSVGDMPAVIDLRAEPAQLERRGKVMVSWEMPDGCSDYRIGHERPDEPGYYWIPFEKGHEVVDGRVQWPLQSGTLDAEGTHTVYVSLRPEDGMTETISAVSFQVKNTRVFAYDDTQQSIFDFTGDFANVTLPSEVEGMPVRTLAKNALKEKSMISLEIPEEITRIEMEAAIGCADLRFLTLNGEHTVVFSRAFANCTSLLSVTLPKDVILHELAFENCSSLEEIIFTDVPKSIGPGAFADCVSLREVVLPEGMTSLTSNPFAGCRSLEAVTFPKSLKTIGSPLQPMVLPEGVTIRGYRGTRAEKYAEVYGYPFEALD